MIICLRYSFQNKYLQNHNLSIHNGNTQSNSMLLIAIITHNDFFWSVFHLCDITNFTKHLQKMFALTMNSPGLAADKKMFTSIVNL